MPSAETKCGYCGKTPVVPDDTPPKPVCEQCQVDRSHILQHLGSLGSPALQPKAICERCLIEGRNLRVMVGSFTVEQIASANFRLWRKQRGIEDKDNPGTAPDKGWSRRQATEAMNAVGWNLDQRTLADLEDRDPESRRWYLADAIAACEAFGKPLPQLLLPPHECVKQADGELCGDHVPGHTERSAMFDELMGTSEAVQQAISTGRMPYTGIKVRTEADDQPGKLPITMNVKQGRSEVGLALFGVDPDALDAGYENNAFRQRREDDRDKLQAVVQAGQELLSRMSDQDAD